MTGHLEYRFEELPLCIGRDKDGKRQNIALLTGSCDVDRDYRSKEWEIVSVTLEGPLLHDQDTVIGIRHPLWDAVTESIEHSCGEEILQEVLDSCEPDPDYAYDRMRDERMERA